MRRGASFQSAFTLLEILVALSLMAVLAGGLFAALHIGFSARERAEASLAPVRTATVALELLRRDVESAPPPTGILRGAFTGTDGLAEIGTAPADAVSFYAVSGDPESGAPIRKLEFLLASDGEGGLNLVRHTTSNLLAPETPEPVEETLCRHVKEFNLRYFDGSAWQDSWDSTLAGSVLPPAIEARLVIHDTRGGKSPDGTYILTRVFRLPCAAQPSDPPAAGAAP